MSVLRGGRTVAVSVPRDSGSGTLGENVPSYNQDSRTGTSGILTPAWPLIFDVDSKMSVAGVSFQDGKVLLDKYTAEAAWKQSKVRFALLPRESGMHAVRLSVSHNKTMVSTTHAITLHVV